jgi:hypothetical protein
MYSECTPEKKGARQPEPPMTPFFSDSVFILSFFAVFITKA